MGQEVTRKKSRVSTGPSRRVGIKQSFTLGVSKFLSQVIILSTFVSCVLSSDNCRPLLPDKPKSRAVLLLNGHCFWRRLHLRPWGFLAERSVVVVIIYIVCYCVCFISKRQYVWSSDRFSFSACVEWWQSKILFIVQGHRVSNLNCIFRTICVFGFRIWIVKFLKKSVEKRGIEFYFVSGNFLLLSLLWYLMVIACDWTLIYINFP